ncbi:Putative F-box-like domain superfamily protein [Septoria linicola]|uniref:F-box-like domain superfamily protein n=1 Tax=Septoria linicola TaxID=215465 RepID=A0A9Q9AHK1_9PEZI|nr:putative F-box-like domain superfamily protein [Septoria linicola]USW47018.1 Putative F-box-like domain superfamily protein [Septoria linicola]
MDFSRPVNPNSFSSRLVSKLGRTFRGDESYSESKDAVEKRKKKEGKKLRKRGLGPTTAPADEVNELGERNYAIFSEQPTMAGTRSGLREKQQDLGEMMHGLANHDSVDSLLDHIKPDKDPYAARRRRRQGMLVSPEHERRVAFLPDELWERIASYLDPVDAVWLALSTKTLHRKLGIMPFQTLNNAENRHYKHAFLRTMEGKYPDQLICFPCAKFHKRLNPGKEQLKIDYVGNPVFLCPAVKSSFLPRTRLAYGRQLPYSFVQLATRFSRFGPEYGIDHSTLSRRWKCKESGWTHRTRYMIHEDRLLLRVVSQAFAPPAKQLTETAERHILYDREEYIPYFSVCAHWRDGDLMKICKCMMSHVPSPPDPIHKQLQRGFKVNRAAASPDFIVRGCDECRPARRCPECPTEYLVEVQMLEDPSDKVFPFKHAIVVTRWSDLGDGSSPYTSPEWAAINGIDTGSKIFNSFSNVGRRAVGGVFESAVSGHTPGQRLLSLNPKNKKLGEEGHGWY